MVVILSLVLRIILPRVELHCRVSRLLEPIEDGCGRSRGLKAIRSWCGASKYSIRWQCVMLGRIIPLPIFIAKRSFRPRRFAPTTGRVLLGAGAKYCYQEQKSTLMEKLRLL